MFSANIRMSEAQRHTIKKGAWLLSVGALLYGVVRPLLIFLPPNGNTVLRVKAERAVALSIDDGPHPQYTTDILDILDDPDGDGDPGNAVKATFFMTGEPQLSEPSLIEAKVLGPVGPGDIIALHDSDDRESDPGKVKREATVKAMRGILAGLEAKGLKVGTVGELLGASPRPVMMEKPLFWPVLVLGLAVVSFTGWRVWRVPAPEGERIIGKPGCQQS